VTVFILGDVIILKGVISYRVPTQKFENHLEHKTP
jgi:hypothetical protein